MPNFDVYVFASSPITNIWAGYGAHLWAVAEPNTESARKGQRTKASKLNVGDTGLLYCEPWKAFTVPFVFASTPDASRSEYEVWSGKWILPFGIRPLGSPRKRIAGEEIKGLPGAQAKGVTNFGHYLKVRGDFSFQPSPIDQRDWQAVLTELI